MAHEIKNMKNVGNKGDEIFSLKVMVWVNNKYPPKVAAPLIINFPIPMKIPPIPATAVILNGFFRMMKKASLAAPQKLFPLIAI